MTKTEQLNELFDQWKLQKFLFCEDGVLCEETYENQKHKILFVLKDVNNQSVEEDERSADGRNIDMRRAVFKPNQGYTWNAIALWAKALTDECNIAFSDVHQQSAQESLSKISFMNIKKDEGGSAIADETLEKYAERDRELLIKQIEICEPDLIVACGNGVFNCMKEVLFETYFQCAEPIAQIHTDDLEYGQIYDMSECFGKQTFLVKYKHPNRCSYEKTYNDMVKIRELVLDK